MQVLQNAQRPEESLQVESSRKTGVLVYKISWESLSVTSRRGFTRRDVKISSLCHVATWIYTSRRQLVQLSVTSRRGPARRDVVWSCALSRRDVNPNVATWACLLSITSRRDPVFSPRMVHFGHSPHAPSLIRTLAPLRPNPHQTCRRSHPTGRRPSTAHRPL